MSADYRLYWNNPDVIKLGQERDHCFLRPYASKAECLQTKFSSRILSLNGLWKFKWGSNPSLLPSDFDQIEHDKSDWYQIPVLSDWQLEGHGVPIYVNKRYVFPKNPPNISEHDNPTGCYYRSFRIPDEWGDMEIFLSFEGVNSAATFWINVHEIGYHQDSKTKAEFHINKWLIEHDNYLAVQVYRWCDGSYLVGQDF